MSSEPQNASSGAEEKRQMMEKMNANKSKPTDRLKEQGERTVKDPVTGMDVRIKDADFKDFEEAGGGKGLNPAALDPARTDVPGPALNAPATAGSTTSTDQPHPINSSINTAPNPSGPGNILLQRFPPPISTSVEPLTTSLSNASIGLTIGLTLIWLFTAFGSGWWRFFLRSTVIGGVGFAVLSAISLVSNGLEKEMERVRMEMHRQRGEKFAPPTPESVEWLNSFVKVVWGLVNSDMFTPIVDMVEDIMQQSLPGFVEAIKISDIGQGTNPFRIISMRALPDQPLDREYPRDAWMNGGEGANTAVPSQGDGNGPMVEKPEGAAAEGVDGVKKEEAMGDYVNYEVSFSYLAKPGQGKTLMTSNIHLLFELFLGVYDWMHIPIPVWIQVEKVVGTIRMRIQFIPEYPFVRNLTVSLMGVPGVEVSAKPMAKALPNVMDLPLISTFTKMAIKAATAEFVAPKSLTLNLQDMLSGPAAEADTLATGVFLITIHHAEDLSAQDSNGLSDPYIVVAYAKFGKPLYSTRIILGDLNPVYEETLAILVSESEKNAKEELSLQLWDSDKRSADDLIGRVSVPVEELMRTENENQWSQRTDKLRGFEDANDMPGTLHWSIGYFTKLEFAQRKPEPKQALKPIAEATTREDRKLEKKEKEVEKEIAEKDPPKDVFNTKPDEECVSGILSMTVHQIMELERQNLKGSTGSNREGQAGQDTSRLAEEAQNLPSGYVEYIVNDEMVYKTRVKPYTTYPFFEAKHELFIRDWRTTVVRFVVRDSRVREKDPILGVISLRLSDVFEKSSSVKQTWSLMEGVGFGRANCSLLFRNIQAKLPPKLLGWETGTAEVLSDVQVHLDASAAGPGGEGGGRDFEGKKLTISTTHSSAKISGKDARVEGMDVVIWQVEQGIRLPLYDRYSQCLLFEIGKDAIAPFWLCDIEDDVEKTVRIPVLVPGAQHGTSLKVLRQNYINDQTAKTHNYRQIGVLVVNVKVDSGLDTDHEKYMFSPGRPQTDRHTYETYDHVEGQAARAEKLQRAKTVDSDGNSGGSLEERELKREHERQLRSRHRGTMQFAPARTVVWMKHGMQEKASKLKKKLTGDTTRQPTVASEA